jgi:hypothetical protein
MTNKRRPSGYLLTGRSSFISPALIIQAVLFHAVGWGGLQAFDQEAQNKQHQADEDKPEGPGGYRCNYSNLPKKAQQAKDNRDPENDHGWGS